MGAFLKIFIAILCMNIVLSIAFPEESQFINDNFFKHLLESETNPITGEREYTDLSGNISQTEWSEGGKQESSFLSKFIDGLSVLKTFIATLINVAVVPITIAVKMQMPAVVRMLVFVPLALIYILTGLMTLVRGVNL